MRGSAPYVFSIDTDNLIAYLETSAIGRKAFIRMCDYAFLVDYSDQCTNASILPGSLDTKRFHVLFGNVICVGVEGFQHSFYAGLNEFARFHFVDIVCVYLLEKCGKNVEAFGDVEVLFSGP